MPTIETLTVDVEANTSKFSKGLKLAGVGLAALVTGAVVAGKAASDLNESINKSSEVFGKGAADIEKFADTAAEKLGLSKTEALDAASNLGLFAQAAGLSGDEVNGFAKEMVGLSGDLASFFNTNPTQALDDLRSGLSGETEPLRKYGVFLNEAAVAQKAYALGIAKTGEELTDGQKIQARYALIMDQTSKAQGDFARTSDGLANSQRIASAEFKNLLATIGTALLPIFQALVHGAMELVTVLQDNVGPVLEAVSDWFQRVWEKVGPFVTLIGSEIVDAFNSMKESAAPVIGQLGNLWSSIQPIVKVLGILVGVIIILYVKALAGWFKAMAKIVSIVISVIGVVARFVTAVASAIGKVIGFFIRLWNGAKEAFGKVIDFVKELPGKIRDVFDGAIDWLFNAGKAILQGLWNGLQNLWDSVWNWFQDKLDALKELPKTLLGIGSPSKVFRGYGQAVGEGFGLGLKDGWPDPFEGTMKIAGSAKHGRGPAGGVTVNVYGSVMSERDLADTIHKALLRSKGRSGALGLA